MRFPFTGNYRMLGADQKKRPVVVCTDASRVTLVSCLIATRRGALAIGQYGCLNPLLIVAETPDCVKAPSNPMRAEIRRANDGVQLDHTELTMHRRIRTHLPYYPALTAIWHDKPGNYLFCKWNGQTWAIQHAGECTSFRTRMPSHERWPEALRDYGVTQAFSHINEGGEGARQTEERDIIQAYNPPMNVHHRTDGLGTGGLGLSGLGRSLLNEKK